MTRQLLAFAALAAVLCLVHTPAARADDGTVLINQATALHGLPGCGSTGFPISPSPTDHPQKSRTARGSRRRNTSSFIRRLERARTSRSRRASNGNANSFTITFCSRRTPACGPMKPGVCNSGT